MQNRTRHHAITQAQVYANRNDCPVFIWEIKNTMHETLWFEWYPEHDPQVKLFESAPDVTIWPA